MGLRFDPMGGGQFKQMVKAIIDAESQPIKQLEARKARENEKLKLFQDFKAKFQGFDKALAEVASFTKFRELKVDLGDGADLVSVTVDKEKAQPGVYKIEVNELASRSSAMSNGWEDPEENVLGAGFITFEGESETKEIYVDQENSSLRGIANLINSHSNLPVRASVIKDSSEEEYPWKLIITGKGEGRKNDLRFPEFYFMDGIDDFYLESDKDARNASILLDDIPIELESNEMKDFMPGVNLRLKGARPEHPFTITISEDTQKMGGKVKSIIEQLNGILGFIVKQNSVDQSTDTTKTFAGDVTLQTIEYRIRNVMHEGFPVPLDDGESYRLVFLSKLGIEFDKSGSLTFKEDKFNQALEKDFEGISEALTGPYGFVTQVRGLMEVFTRSSNGTLQTREKGLRDRIKNIDEQIENKQRQVDKKAAAVTEQFSRLQGTLGNLQKQQQFLAASLPGAGGGNPISQLIGGM